MEKQSVLPPCHGPLCVNCVSFILFLQEVWMQILKRGELEESTVLTSHQPTHSNTPSQRGGWTSARKRNINHGLLFLVSPGPFPSGQSLFFLCQRVTSDASRRIHCVLRTCHVRNILKWLSTNLGVEHGLQYSNVSRIDFHSFSLSPSPHHPLSSTPHPHTHIRKRTPFHTQTINMGQPQDDTPSSNEHTFFRMVDGQSTSRAFLDQGLALGHHRRPQEVYC
jgi:hypothetical protein